MQEVKHFNKVHKKSLVLLGILFCSFPLGFNLYWVLASGVFIAVLFFGV